jgi:hypothetical protein
MCHGEVLMRDFPLPEIIRRAITGELDQDIDLRMQRASELAERVAISHEMVWRSLQLLAPHAKKPSA